jgi:hypothetical protein
MEDNEWGVQIAKSWRHGDLWCFWCFPYYTNHSGGPYPGFEYLKIWLNMNCPSAAYEVNYNNGEPKLEVTFNDPEEAILFRMTFS